MQSGFGISARLTAVIGAVVLAFVALAAYTMVSLRDVKAVAARAEGNRVPQLHEVAQVELLVTRSSLQLRHAMLARTPAERDAAFEAIASHRKAIDANLADYEARLFTDQGRARFQPVKGLVQQFWTAGDATAALVRAGRNGDAFGHLVDTTIPARNALLTVLEDTHRYQVESISRDIDSIDAAAGRLLAVLVGALAALGLALGGFALWLRRRLLARVAVARTVTERVRDGDLSTRLHDGAADEFSPLLAALRTMQAALTDVVGRVRDGAQGVASASVQIADGSQDLSSRTEQQASALQQTASTMEELGTTVRHNAEHAAQASELAREAARVAGEGGALMGQVVSTMDGIARSSDRITAIIGTIDGIAFQTNILALNAAVEAARAGEQGRGFAVVAGEVRTLAQRSAEAAREIKQLIAHSGEQVTEGAGLVGTAGRTMEHIVGSINRVNEIVHEISEASRNQSTGVQQVAAAIAELDRTTQRNAALVEQSAAAAGSMRKQAQQLTAAMAAFSLPTTPQGA